MTPEEFAIARGKLGWSDEKLAAELGVSPKAVRGWADGSLRIPKHEAQSVAWHAALVERQAALQAAGIPECDWVKAWEAEPLPKRTEDLEPHFKRVETHADQCPICQERERFLRERFPPMPELPVTGLPGVMLGWQRWLSRFPEWTHPVFNGAAIVAALVAMRIVVMVPRGVSWIMLVALVGGALFGAIGGLAYSALRPYIAAGGGRKSFAQILVLLAYCTAGLAVALPGPITLGSFLVVAALVVVLWRRSLNRDIR